MKYISSVHDQNTARGRARNALTARPIATDREHAPPTLVTARGVGHAGAYHPQRHGVHTDPSVFVNFGLSPVSALPTPLSGAGLLYGYRRKRLPYMYAYHKAQ